MEKFFLKSRRKREGKEGRSLGFEIVLGFLSKGRDLQDFINSVNLRTLFPERFRICGFTTVSA